VKEYFSRFGYVLDVYLPRDKTNKREHRGFGFVTFETEASIHRVVTHGTHHIRGTVVAIDAAVPRQEELLPPGDPGMQGAVAPPPAAAAAADPESIPQAFEGLTLEAGAQAGGGAAPGGPPQGLSY